MDTTTANGVNSTEPPGRPQLHNLTALRAFAALSIFIHHLKVFGIDASQSIRNMDLECAVSFFFVLSGFVLSYSFAGRFLDWRDVRHFVFQRFFRLWPVHMLCSFVALVTLHEPASLLTAYLTTTLQSSWIPTYGTAYAYNGVSWSISVELFFYLLLPFILILRPNQIHAGGLRLDPCRPRPACVHGGFARSGISAFFRTTVAGFLRYGRILRSTFSTSTHGGIPVGDSCLSIVQTSAHPRRLVGVRSDCGNRLPGALCRRA